MCHVLGRGDGPARPAARCEKLGLLDKSSVGFIKGLGDIRNRLVHNIKRVDFSLKTYFQELEPNQFHELRKKLDFIFGEKTSINVAGQDVETAEVFKANTRLLITASLGHVLVLVHAFTVAAKSWKEFSDQQKQFWNQLVLAELQKPADK